MTELGQYEWQGIPLEKPFQYGEKLCDISMILTHPEYLKQQKFGHIRNLGEQLNNFQWALFSGETVEFPTDNRDLAIALYRTKMFLECFVQNDRAGRIFQQPMALGGKRRLSLDASHFSAEDASGYIQLLDHMLQHMPKLSWDEKSDPDDVALLVRMPRELKTPRSVMPGL